MDVLFLLLSLAQLRRPRVVAGAAVPPSGPPSPQRNIAMPTATPLPLIKPANWLFSSIDIDTVAYAFSAVQLPSTYYMLGNGPFIRLRPLHKSGLGIFEKATRIVGLYAGRWNAQMNFGQNVQNNAGILYRELGTSAGDIANNLALLQQATLSTAQIINQNTAQNPPALNNAVVFVDTGPLAGTIWGGDAQKTANRYAPLKVVDARDAGANAHTGHPFATRDAAQQFYADHYPGVLGQLMLLGQSQQSFAIDLAPKGRRLPFVVHSDLQYFAQDMFESRDEQLDFLRNLYMSFV